MSDPDVVRRTRGDGALRWAAVGTLAVVALVCSFLPVAHLEVSGFVGAGETQRVYDLERDVALVPDLLPRSLVIVLPALALLAQRSLASSAVHVVGWLCSHLRRGWRSPSPATASR